MDLPSIAHMASWSIHIQERTASRLVVVCPPFYLAALASFLVVFIAGAVVYAFTHKIALTVLLPVCVVCLGLATSGGSAVIDRSTGTLQVRRTIFAIFVREKIVPLSEVKGVVIETGKGTGRLTFAMRDRSYLPVGFLTSQSGLRQTAEDVDSFLGQAR